MTDPTEEFILACNSFFQNPDDSHVITKNGVDISEDFFMEYYSTYISGDYDTLWKIAENELREIWWKTGSTANNTMMPMGYDITETVSEQHYVLDETVDHMPGKTFNFLYTVSGSYTYADSTGQIKSATDPSFSLDYFEGGALFSSRIYNLSLSTEIAPDDRSVTFSATFELELSFCTPGGYTLWTEDFGPYTGSATGVTYY